MPIDASPRLSPASAPSIDLWLAFEAEITDPLLLRRLALLLGEPEHLQHQRFRAAADQHRYLVTRALVRTVLSRYAPVAPHEWLFAPTAHGRPEIAPSIVEHCREAEGLCFNISHTRGLVVVAVCRHRALGVDVETLPLLDEPDEVVANFFSPTEREAFARAPASMRAERFGEYWTFKESYIKARGEGLSLPLDRFSIHLPDTQSVGLSIDAPFAHEAERWLFWQFKPTPHHLLAVCSESQQGDVPSLTLKQAVPTVSEQLLDLPLLRHST